MVVTMKQILLLAALFGLATASIRVIRQEPGPPPIVDLRSQSTNFGNGTFKAAVERSDGSKIYSAGYIRNPEEPEPENRVQVILGSYSHIDNNGEEYTVTYLADDTGYHVDGAHVRGSIQLPEYVYRIVDNVRNDRDLPISEFA